MSVNLTSQTSKMADDYLESPRHNEFYFEIDGLAREFAFEKVCEKYNVDLGDSYDDWAQNNGWNISFQLPEIKDSESYEEIVEFFEEKWLEKYVPLLEETAKEYFDSLEPKKLFDLAIELNEFAFVVYSDEFVSVEKTSWGKDVYRIDTKPDCELKIEDHFCSFDFEEIEKIIKNAISKFENE